MRYSPEGRLPRDRQSSYGLRGMPWAGVAPWRSRALAALVDVLLLAPFGMLHALVQAHKDASGPYSGTAGGAVVASMLLAAAGLSVFVWNTVLRQGATGQTIGKTVLRIKLVREGTDLPIGQAAAALRQFAHIADALPVGLGYLWPLWDGKRQTFADKLAGTVVVAM